MSSNADDLTPQVINNVGTAPNPDREELIRRLERLSAQPAAPQAEPAAQPDPAVDAVRKTVKDESEWLVLGEAGRAAIGGARDAVQEVMEFAADSANWATNNLFELRAPRLPEVAENVTTGGKVARSVTQFVLPFLGYAKALSKLKSVGSAMKFTAAGAATDATAFDPHEKRLSNLIMEMSDNDPVMGEAIFGFLAADPSDSDATGRAKNAIEGLGLGLGAELVFRSLRLFKARKLSEGKDPHAEAVRLATGDGTPSAPAGDLTVTPKDGIDYSKVDPELVPKGPSDKMDDILPWLEVDGHGNNRRMVTPQELAPIEQMLKGSKLAIDDTPLPSSVSEAVIKRTVEEKAAAVETLIQGTYREQVLKGFLDAIPEVTARAAKEGPQASDPMVQAFIDAVPGLRAAAEAGNLPAVARSQAGFVDPQLLTRLIFGSSKGEFGSGVAGAAAAYAQAPEDATPGEKFQYAAMGFALGRGVFRMIPRKSPAAAAREASLARPGVSAVAPKAEASVTAEGAASVAARPVKATPRVSSVNVDKIMSAITEGRVADVAKTIDESDFNLDKIDTAEDVKELVDAFSGVFAKSIDEAKHGTQSFADIRELAEELGAGAATMKEMYQGTDNLAARVYSHRVLLAASAEKIKGLSTLAIKGDQDAVLAMRKHVVLHATMQAQMKGVQTEVARALSQFRMTATTVDLSINERNLLLEAMGGHKVNNLFAQKLSQISDPKKLNAFIRRGALARSQDAVFEAWVNGMLSGPVTHAVNIVANSVVAVGSIAERVGAGLIGTVLRNPDAVRASEVKYYVYGMVEGLKDALRLTSHGMKELGGAASMWRDGDAASAVRAVEQADVGSVYKAFALDQPVLDNAAYGTRQIELQTPSITAENFGLDPKTFVGRAVEYAGVLVRTPGRALAATDELFKTVFYRGELKAQAYRRAVSKGLSGDEMFAEMAKLIDDPTPEMRGLALRAAREGTFTSPLGEAGLAIQGAVAKVPGARYIMPFVRTSINLLKHTYDRAPFLNLIEESNRSILMAGGRERDALLARYAMGGALLAVASTLVSRDMLTGTSFDKQRTAEKAGGVQELSLRIGDEQYSYARLDPYGAFFGLVADFKNISGHLGEVENDKIATAIMLSISKNLASKAWLTGLVDLIEAFGSQEPNAVQKWLNRQAGSIVPSMSNAIRREMDPEVKEVWTMMDAIKARIPGLSKDIPPQVNLLGEDVVYQGGLGPDIASPVATMTRNPEPIAREIARLDLDLKHPLREISIGNGAPGIELNHQQYYRLMKLAGNELKVNGKGFKEAANELVQSRRYIDAPEDPSQKMYKQSKQLMIEMMYQQYKQAATFALLKEDPELMRRFEQGKRNVGNALTGKPVVPIN